MGLQPSSWWCAVHVVLQMTGEAAATPQQAQPRVVHRALLHLNYALRLLSSASSILYFAIVEPLLLPLLLLLFAGTTTATVLARAILNEGCKSVAAGMNPMDLRRGINLAVDNVLQVGLACCCWTLQGGRGPL